ncbi:MAG: SpoIID/LytB domain-containing protein [Planctomycetaceae bacterium]
MTETRIAPRTWATRCVWGAVVVLLAGLIGRLGVGPVRQPVVLEVPGRLAAIESGHHVRVNLTPQPVRELTVEVQAGFQVRPVGSDRVLFRSNGKTAIHIRASLSGLQFGTREIAVGRIVIHPEKTPSIWVNGHMYRGDLYVHRRSSGRVIAVNVVDLEHYVASVVDSEMPLTFPAAARRAQAIIARTYVLYQQQLAGVRREFDVYATTRSQKYQGYQYRDGRGRKLAGESDSSRQVARDTAGTVALYRGDLFAAYYSAVCGGRTTSGQSVFSDAVDALASVPCPWCRAAQRYRWKRRAQRDQAAGLLTEYFRTRGKSFQQLKTITSLDQIPDQSRGRMRFQVGDGNHTYEIDGRALRSLFPSGLLPSPYFTARLDDGHVVFDGRGHGHGVGLCQWGARGQALAGRSAPQIIESYYPGVSLVTLDLQH